MTTGQEMINGDRVKHLAKFDIKINPIYHEIILYTLDNLRILKEDLRPSLYEMYEQFTEGFILN